MISLIKVKRTPKGVIHKRFIKTCNLYGIKVQAIPGTSEGLWFKVDLSEEQTMNLCKITSTVYYPLDWINDRSKLRTSNYESIYGEL